MREMLQYIQQANQTFWGTDVNHLWFYAAVLLIILLEKDKIAKRIIGIYPVCFLLALYNPVAYKLVQTYTSGKWQYFARLYAMIPLPLTLGLGTVLLIDVICSRVTDASGRKRKNAGPVLKLVMTGCFCGIMIWGGTSIYQQDWYRPTQNIAKVPDDALYICKELHCDEGVTVAVPASLSSYIRQIDAGIFTPYGRYTDQLGDELSKECPDPEYVMTEAGRRACDYIVIANNEDNISQFRLKGWEPASVQGRYLIYKVENVLRVKKTYNSKHQLYRQTMLDVDGTPVQNAYGTYGIQYEYDREGRIVKQTYLNQDNKPAAFPKGYTSVEYLYDGLSKRIASKRYLDEKDEPVCCFGRFETRYEYNPGGQLIQEKFFDADGELMDDSRKHYAIREIQRDEKGRTKRESWFNREGRPARTSMGYSSYEVIRNENDEIIQEAFYDADNMIIGKTGKEIEQNKDLFLFHHSSDGAIENGANGITFSTVHPGNRFNLVCFQLFNASTGEYLTSFGIGEEAAEYSGIYQHQLPDGLYTLCLKANSNLSDETIKSPVYLRQGDQIAYSYIVNELRSDQITLKELSVLMKP